MTNTSIEDILVSYSSMLAASLEQTRPGGRNQYLRLVTLVTDLINDSGRDGDLEENLAIISGSLEHDLEHFGSNPKSRAVILQNRENMERGMHHQRVLRDHPEAYRTLLAPGFIRRECKENGSIPKDGMQKALASHRNHMVARHSLLLSEAEQNLVVAQLFLTQTTIKRYTDNQRTLLYP